MLDSQKILLIVSYLLRYPDQQWRSEFPSWKWEAENSVQHQLLRESLIEFFEYVEETGLIDLENQYVESFDFSKNTTLYMSTYELQGNGEQSEQLVQFSADFLENGYDLPHKETPDYLPALLELLAAVDEKAMRKIFKRILPYIEYLRQELIKAELPYALLLDVVLAVANGLEESAHD